MWFNFKNAYYNLDSAWKANVTDQVITLNYYDQVLTIKYNDDPDIFQQIVDEITGNDQEGN